MMSVSVSTVNQLGRTRRDNELFATFGVRERRYKIRISLSLPLRKLSSQGVIGEGLKYD